MVARLQIVTQAGINKFKKITGDLKTILRQFS
jgi:hypothetical protein